MPQDKKKPIIVNDKNDPRLKLYNDSLSLFKSSDKGWFWPGAIEVPKSEYDKKYAEDLETPHYSFDEDQFSKDKKNKKVKPFNDYIYKIYSGKDAFKGDKKAEDAYNRNIGKNFQDSPEPIIEKNKDGTENIYHQYYKGKIDKSYFENYDPITKTSRSYSNSKGDGSKETLLSIYNPVIKPVKYKYRALKDRKLVGGITISEDIKKSTNGITDFEKNSKTNYKEYSWGTDINEIYKKPDWEVIYDPSKYDINDPRLNILQNSVDKNFKNFKDKKPVQPVILEDKPKLETIKPLSYKAVNTFIEPQIAGNIVVPEISKSKTVVQNYTAAKQLEKMKKPTGYINQGDKQGIQEFKNGGQLGSTLGSLAGMAIGSIIAPGIGTTIGSTLGSQAGNFIQKQFKMGGELTHYKGDPSITDGITVGNNKVDHNETNHQGYIFSDTLQLGKKTFAEISKKIESKYSKRLDDKITKESKQRELDNLAKIQEATGMTNQGNKMWSGGWINNINKLVSNRKPLTPMDTTMKGNEFYNIDMKELAPNNTTVVDDGVINLDGTKEPILSSSTISKGSGLITPTFGDKSNINIDTNNLVIPNSTDNTKPLQTDVNPMGYIASNIGPAFDILQGLKGGDPVNFDRVKPTYANPNPAITAMNNTTSTSFNNARNAIRNNASSAGEYLAMMNNLSGSESLKRGLGRAQIKSEYDKINTGTANQIASQNAGIQMNEATARQMETDTARSSVSQGLHNIGANTLGFGQDVAANKTQNTMLPMLSDGYEYYIKEDGTVASRRKKGTTNSNYQFTPKPE